MDILIVEDDSRLGRSVKRGLVEAGFTATLVRSVAEARTAIDADTFRLAVLDLGLADGDGMDLLAEWRRDKPAFPVVITTARGDLADRLRGLESGADDYLVKPYAFGELIARIRVQFRHADKAIALEYRIGDLLVNLRARRAERAGQVVDLTPKEFDLLVYLADNRGHVVTREMLARDVWQVRSRMTSLDNVIDVHMSRLRDKVDKASAHKMIQTVRGVGFTLREAT